MNNPKESTILELVTYRGVVYPWHCDHIGHMNVMWYVGKFDEATSHLFASLGITPTYIRDNERGMVAVEQRISYKRELLAGDVITIRSGILEMKDKVIPFCHEMQNQETGEIAAITVLTGIHLDRRVRNSCPFPEDVLARAGKMIVAYDPGI
jgi:acyl-CoA thioester hydrolase